MSARLEFGPEHQQFRELVRDFVQRTVIGAPSNEKTGCRDGSLFTEAGNLGLLIFSVPEHLGGQGVNGFRYNATVVEELQAVSSAAETVAFSLQYDIVL